MVPILGWSLYERRRRTERQGKCPRCARQSTLEGYDARQRFHFYYVPLTAGRRIRTRDYCPLCKWYLDVPLDVDIAEAVRETAPLRASFDGGDLEAGLERARVLHARGRCDLAAGQVAEAVRRAPGRVDARLLQASVAEDDEEWAVAVEALEAARRLAPDSAAILLRLAKTLTRARRHEEAARAYRDLTRGDPVGAAHLQSRARALAECRPPRDAEVAEAYDELEARCPAHAWDTYDRWTHDVTSAPRGPHVVEVRASSETARFEIDAQLGTMDNLFHGGAIVIDARGVGAYDVYEVAYGGEPERKSERFVCERTFEVARITDRFRAPPSTVTLKNREVQRRIVLERDRRAPLCARVPRG